MAQQGKAITSPLFSAGIKLYLIRRDIETNKKSSRTAKKNTNQQVRVLIFDPVLEIEVCNSDQ
jgi:hypothetical protein